MRSTSSRASARERPAVGFRPGPTSQLPYDEATPPPPQEPPQQQQQMQVLQQQPPQQQALQESVALNNTLIEERGAAIQALSGEERSSQHCLGSTRPPSPLGHIRRGRGARGALRRGAPHAAAGRGGAGSGPPLNERLRHRSPTWSTRSQHLSTSSATTSQKRTRRPSPPTASSRGRRTRRVVRLRSRKRQTGGAAVRILTVIQGWSRRQSSS